METMFEPAVVDPIVSPDKVTARAVLAATEDDPDRVSNKKFAVVVPTDTVTLPLQDASGVSEATKKPEG